MGFIFFFIAACLIVSAVIKLLMATHAPKAYEAMVVDGERRRQRRNELLKTGIGIAAKFIKK